MKIYFYLAHPAHYHLFKFTISELRSKGHELLISCKNKDILINLLKENQISFINIEEKERKSGTMGILTNLVKRLRKHHHLIRNFRPHVVLSSSAELGLICKVSGIPFLNVFEDDIVIFPIYYYLLGPFIHRLICPDSCKSGIWEKKTIHYNGNQELAYLRPEHFAPDISKVNKILDPGKKSILIRFSKLSAWHDSGKTGISNQLADQLISLLIKYGNVYISSERELPSNLERFRFNLNINDMHHFMYFADLFIGDSQTMTAEAAVLGTPSVRFNDFVGKLGYLEELEHTYGLTYGIPTNEPGKLLTLVEELISDENLKQKWQIKRDDMLRKTINVSTFLTSLIEKHSPDD